MAPTATGSSGGPISSSKSKKRNLLDESESDSDDGGAAVQDNGFKVNEEFARRFEHNKKREEQQKLEEKYKKASARDADESSSDDETEDEEGFLATEDLDAQISATLNAIRSKDPRVYDNETTFYQTNDKDDVSKDKSKKEKPVFLQDYHREKILRGDAGASDGEDDEEPAPPQTYNQEQEALKKSFMTGVDAAKDGADSSDDDDEDEGFMKRKEPAKADANGLHPSRAATIKIKDLDVEGADKDPETFLSNFMAARAWVGSEGSQWQPFESEDEDENNQADQFEEAYNLRFENPEKSNEVLKSYARDITASRSVRREEKSKRKKTRDTEREKKDEEREQRKEEKARLRKLKLEEAEGKLSKIKQAAGATGKELTDRDWISFLNDAWEDDKWEEEMQRRFGDDYYAVKEDLGEAGEDAEEEAEEEEEEEAKHKRKTPKKPKWDDDIDIKDIVPDFEDEDDRKPEVSLSDTDGQQADNDEDADEEERPSKKLKASDHKRARLESQRKARQERTKLEALVDSKLELTDHDLLNANAKTSSSQPASSSSAAFRYREVSPQAFGMTPRDILLAPSDQALNEYAGLKKLASFRDGEKKRKDKKKLGKKARLRQWRKDYFGREFERTGPTYGFEAVAGQQQQDGGGEREEVPRARLLAGNDGDGDERMGNVVGDVGGGKKTKKRKRSKGKKSEAA